MKSFYTVLRLTDLYKKQYDAAKILHRKRQHIPESGQWAIPEASLTISKHLDFFVNSSSSLLFFARTTREFTKV